MTSLTAAPNFSQIQFYQLLISQTPCILFKVVIIGLLTQIYLYQLVGTRSIQQAVDLDCCYFYLVVVYCYTDSCRSVYFYEISTGCFFLVDVEGTISACAVDHWMNAECHVPVEDNLADGKI